MGNDERRQRSPAGRRGGQSPPRLPTPHPGCCGRYTLDLLHVPSQLNRSFASAVSCSRSLLPTPPSPTALRGGRASERAACNKYITPPRPLPRLANSLPSSPSTPCLSLNYTFIYRRSSCLEDTLSCCLFQDPVEVTLLPCQHPSSFRRLALVQQAPSHPFRWSESHIDRPLAHIYLDVDRLPGTKCQHSPTTAHEPHRHLLRRHVLPRTSPHLTSTLSPHLA